MKKILLVLVVAVLILPSLSCFANEVKDYAESKNLTLEVLEIIAPLGENGMNENEKALIDEISILPEDIQRDETLLVLFDEIAKDTIVGQDELDRFRDLDQDGLSNQEELEVGTDLLEKDTDNDGLTDFEEVSVYKTDPIEEDSDNDLLKDGAEVLAYKTDPLKPDSDNDRLTDGEEILTYGADPSNPDSDYDGLRDGEEVKDYKTDPINQDTDKDGLSDGDEVLEELWRRYRTDPLKVDSDYDSFTDGEEILVLRSDPLDEDDPFIFIKTSEDSDGDGVMDCDDPEPLKVNLYREIVSWLSKEMKEDALSCIVEGDKVRTFSNLCQKVFENVPHAWSQRGAKAYPKDAYAGRRNIEELNSTWQGPRDILMNFYTYHQKVKHAPLCFDIACVYDIMADYIIGEAGWDEEGEMQGNNGVDCDVFPCLLNGESHSICIVNITGVEYVADPGSQNFFKLGQNGRYEFPWENKGWKLRSGTWSKEGAMGQAFFCKFDKRFDYSAYDRQWYTNLEPSWWDIFINQTPENEEALRDLYEKLKPPY